MLTVDQLNILPMMDMAFIEFKCTSCGSVFKSEDKDKSNDSFELVRKSVKIEDLKCAECPNNVYDVFAKAYIVLAPLDNKNPTDELKDKEDDVESKID